jgi:hypothetical protein
VSSLGFGKALYITHPNGFVSVYGHLQSCSGAIAGYVKSAQYRAESFEIELFPAKDELPVKKGDLVALSGNSGSSGGPHLHFEMRDEATQYTINPLLFGYAVKDIYRPKITSVKIYPENENSKVNGKNKPARFLTEGWGEEHRLADAPAITLSGNISFAVQVYDQQNDTDNKNGPYSIVLFIDGAKVYDFTIETFAFDQTRYVNSLLDYEELVRNNVRLIRTCVDPGNHLDIYDEVKNRGIYSFTDTLMHTIRYEVTDVPGNVAVLEFKVRSEKQESRESGVGSRESGVSSRESGVGSRESAGAINSKLFDFNTLNHFETSTFSLDAPKGAFYRSFEFQYDSSKQLPGTYSQVHKVHNKFTPVHDYITIAIKPVRLPEKLRGKALVVKVNEGGGFTSAGGQFDGDGWVRTKIREFGNYSIAIDTIAPRIKPVNAEAFKSMAGQKTLKMNISDDLSGVSTYRGTLNGQWILMDYDAKNSLLTYIIDERLRPGENVFELKVTDGKGNAGLYKTTLNR